MCNFASFSLLDSRQVTCNHIHMTSNKIFLAIVIILIIISAFLLLSNRDNNKTATQIVPQPTIEPTKEIITPTAMIQQLIIELKEENKSGESGTAIIKEENGSVVANIVLAGAPSDIAQPAHIHAGTCPGLGVIKYPLKSVLNGKSETILSGLTMNQIKTALPLSVNVHKSAVLSKVYVACGEIKTEETMTKPTSPSTTDKMIKTSPTMHPTATPTPVKSRQ